jgi:hypothetical protein
MEKFPKIINNINLPVDIDVPSYIKDHNFNGRVVFPAVESCQFLAGNIIKQIPGTNPCYLYDALFDKFIDIRPDQTIIKAFNEIDVYDNGDIISKLITKVKSEKAEITRAVKHVTIKFKNSAFNFQESLFENVPALDGIFFEIPKEKIYKELVQFGPAYHNIADTVRVTEKGAAAKVFAAPHAAPVHPLGSPFPFDAALHAACVWGQRYCNIAAFPVGFNKRFIIRSTIPGQIYFTRIIPRDMNDDTLFIDLWIYDINGKPNEAAFGVKLKDTNAGKIKPPEWIRMGV